MILAVLDTNVLASGTLGLSRANSTPGELLRRWRSNAFVLVVSDHILTELTRTLSNPYFTRQLSRNEVDTASAMLRADAMNQQITISVAGVASHPEDDPVLAAALSAKADCLVTGDRQLLQRGVYEGVYLLSPRQFLAELARSDNEQWIWEN